MIEMNVKNMTCGHCVNTVTKAIQSVDAGARVQIDLQTGRVQADSSADAVALVEAVQEAGYPAAQSKAGYTAPSQAHGCCCSR